ncbi:MAG: hypothetical protein LUH14_08700, partial [Clostridiaceae bacterium]|nr:hypothetical protein [Clostridiaceae bacterium]
LEELSDTTLKDMDYESFSNLSVDSSADYVSVVDYAYGENAHFDIQTMEKVFSFDEDSYYFYNDDRTKLMIAGTQELVVYRSADGEELERVSLMEGYDRGAIVGDYRIFGNDSSILIYKDGQEEALLEDAVIYSISDRKNLLFYRNEKETVWYVYSLDEGKVVCEGEAGTYSCTMLFDEGNYLLNDYTAVYDTDTWEKVLDLSEISTGVYGVSTTAQLPYFVVWYQSGNTTASGKSSGVNTAYLYSKEYAGEIVGVIPNYVTTAEDGEVIVYDGDHTLYKFPLYQDTEILEKAAEYVKDITFTQQQREKYHIYTE